MPRRMRPGRTMHRYNDRVPSDCHCRWCKEPLRRGRSCWINHQTKAQRVYCDANCHDLHRAEARRGVA